MAGRHLHGRDQLAGAGGEGAAGSRHVLCCVLDQMTECDDKGVLLLSMCLQKYLQQLWDTVLLVALILSTGVIVQARWQHQGPQLNDDLELQVIL